MRRLIALALTMFSLAAGVTVLAAAPAHANAAITATSVALDDSAACDDGDLDIGMDAVSVSREAGVTTNLAGETLGEFEQPGSWDGFDGVYEGYGQPVSPAQPDGTIIGSYAYIGQTPPAATDSAEWFVLYRCSTTPGANTVLYECFGDYGTCPQTAVEAAEMLFTATATPTDPAPGGTITVQGTCAYPLAGVVLRDGATGLGGDVTEPGADGSFTVELTVPAATAPGAALTVQVDCGYEGETVLSVEIPVTVAGAAPTTSTTSTTAAPAAQPVTPRFTG